MTKRIRSPNEREISRNIITLPHSKFDYVEHSPTNIDDEIH